VRRCVREAGDRCPAGLPRRPGRQTGGRDGRRPPVGVGRRDLVLGNVVGDGKLAEVLVAPGTPVEAGELIVRYES